MQIELIEKVLTHGSHDTNQFRYISQIVNDADSQYRVIKRIALDALDTTAALSDASDTNPDGWKIVHTIK